METVVSFEKYKKKRDKKRLNKFEKFGLLFNAYLVLSLIPAASIWLLTVNVNWFTVLITILLISFSIKKGINVYRLYKTNTYYRVYDYTFEFYLGVIATIPLIAYFLGMFNIDVKPNILYIILFMIPQYYLIIKYEIKRKYHID